MAFNPTRQSELTISQILSGAQKTWSRVRQGMVDIRGSLLFLDASSKLIWYFWPKRSRKLMHVEIIGRPFCSRLWFEARLSLPLRQYQRGPHQGGVDWQQQALTIAGPKKQFRLESHRILQRYGIEFDVSPWLG